MTQYFAFLRAINAGRGRTVKMARLVEIFSSLGFENVHPFEASGNIIFASASTDPLFLEQQIEPALLDVLGYQSDTFLRTAGELVQIASFLPYAGEEIKLPAELNVLFLKETAEEPLAAQLAALSSDTNEFRLLGKEIYWLRRQVRPSTYTTVPLERTLRRPFTIRSSRTIMRLVEKEIKP